MLTLADQAAEIFEPSDDINNESPANQSVDEDGSSSDLKDLSTPTSSPSNHGDRGGRYTSPGTTLNSFV